MNDIPPLLNPPTPPVRRSGWVVFGVIVSFFLVLSVIANLALLGLLMGNEPVSFEEHSRRFQEHYVMGNRHAHDKIVEIDLDGVIGFDMGSDGFSEGMVGKLKDQLDQALEDKRVKAIVLRINSPGGEVVASDAIYRTLADARNDTNRTVKIVACIETVGASGAYYAAMGTDYIVANELSITASIGVIMQTWNFGPFDDTNSLMHKIGVRSYTFKSGKLKDILNPTRTPTDEELKLVNNLVMEVYDKFVGIVAFERGLDVEQLKNTIADGRIVSGKQAKEAKLVDETGYFEDAVDAAEELAKIKDAKVVRYLEPFSLRNVFRILGKADNTKKLQVELSPNPFKLQAGKLYFLPAYMFQ